MNRKGRGLWRDPLELTDRELRIALLLADDFSNAEIAEELGIREHSVGTPIAIIFEKLDIRDRKNVAGKLRERGFLE